MTDQIIDEPRGVAALERPQANDLRHAMMTLPVEQQSLVLAEYVERRTHFRKFLLSQLKEGVHYGFPPGCEPKSKEAGGVVYYAVWMRGGEQWFPETQWKPKPPLYAAGADFICDLLGVRAVFAADVAAWTQLGSRAGSFVISCHLFSRATSELIGEGRGCRSEGDKKGDANNAIKMAEKSAKVDAVINSYGLRDLFTQDDVPPPPADNPPADPQAPQAQPRSKRDKPPLRPRIDRIGNLWKAANPRPDADKVAWSAAFKLWVCQTAGRPFNAGQETQWTEADCVRCEQALGVDAGGAHL